MAREERQFLDLDHVCDQIVSEDDRAMFAEAIRCYQIGSHRAAVILAWCVTADCLHRRVQELASDGDGDAQAAVADLKNVEGQACFEENLLSKARKCNFCDTYEEKCLRFARDIRSKCAHPGSRTPSAETVRQILYSCSQFVLCCNGYRGISYVKQFVSSTLGDRHLFADSKDIPKSCEYYLAKVPERLWPQFAAQYVTELAGTKGDTWESNALVFLSELLKHSSADLAKKASEKLQPLDSDNTRLAYSILLGADSREGIYDSVQQQRARAHLRETLQSGRVNRLVFSSYANMCCRCGFEDADEELFQKRFAAFSEHISQHEELQRTQQKTLLKLLLNGLDDSSLEAQSLQALECLLTSQFFSEDLDELYVDLVQSLIDANWRHEGVASVLQALPTSGEKVKVAFLRKTRDYFDECSEDCPDDVYLVFEVANSLLSSNPTLVPGEFEAAIVELVADPDDATSWTKEQGDAWSSFIGQVSLLKVRHRADLPQLVAVDLPEPDNEDEGDENDDE